MEETIKKSGVAGNHAANGKFKCRPIIRQGHASKVDNSQSLKSSLQRIDSQASGPYDGNALKVAARGLCARTAAFVGGVI